MRKIFAVVIREMREALPAALFFFVAFHILAITKTLILEDYKVTPVGASVATIGALIVAKVILIADKLPFIRVFHDKPLIYSVVWKTINYGVIVVLFRYVEELVPMLSEYGGFVSANRHLIDEVSWPHFWAVQIWLVLTLFFYCLVVEFSHAIGVERTRKLIFG